MTLYTRFAAHLDAALDVLAAHLETYVDIDALLAVAGI